MNMDRRGAEVVSGDEEFEGGQDKEVVRGEEEEEEEGARGLWKRLRTGSLRMRE